MGDDTTGDTDGDLVCDDVDPCPNAFFDDTDGDTVCDDVDICEGGDDLVDADGDALPDFCDACPVYTLPRMIGRNGTQPLPVRTARATRQFLQICNSWLGLSIHHRRRQEHLR